MTRPPRTFPHILLPNHGQAEGYRSPPGGSPRPPARDRGVHASSLTQQLTQVEQGWQAAIRDPALAVGEQGRYVTVTTTSADAVQKLELPSVGIEVTSVQQEGQHLIATVFLPENHLGHFRERVEMFATEETTGGNPRYANLVTRIEGFSDADVRSALVGVTPEERDLPEAQWWEIWVRAGHAADLRSLAGRLQLTVSERTLTFPDREVLLLHADLADLQKIWDNSSTIAEIRLFRDTPGVYLRLQNDEQKEWNDEAIARLQAVDAEATSAVLVLDSGVNRDHPLLDPFIPANAWIAWDPTWTAADTGWNGHGTAMAGLALHGDFYDLLRSTTPRKLSFHLESARILPPSGYNRKELYGKIVQEAVTKMEAARPGQRRTICMAVTSQEDVFRGRPSSWSAALDQLAAGAERENGSPRLIVVSAGNNSPATADLITDYLGSADTAQVHNPAQAWNVLTVGAFTERTTVTDATYAGWTPVAPAGDLAPTSSTSVTWEAQWPLKPDVVFEGGNIITDGATQQLPHDDLRLITASDLLPTEQIRPFGDTSGAAALAARMAGDLMSAHPALRPETIRALIAHSARWTPAMEKRLAGRKRRDVGTLLKRYGYGVPSLERALHSLSNEVTLVIEQSIQPYDRDGKPHLMHLHELPWAALGAVPIGTQIEMQVTLSYFIEPNPSERSYVRRFRYASHGLRFAMKGPLESAESFKGRLLREESEEGDIQDPAHEHWFLGPSLRQQGSLHGDTWQGDISQLMACNVLAVYPVSGWWREKRSHYRKQAPYSLLVTLRVPDVTIDLYTPIAVSLGIPVPTPVEVVTEI